MFEENQLLSIQHQWVESIGDRGTELHLPGILDVWTSSGAGNKFTET